MTPDQARRVRHWAVNPTYYSIAQYAILGSSQELGNGILAWFTNENDARRSMQNLSKIYKGQDEGFVMVKAPKGEIDDTSRQYTHNLIFNNPEYQGRYSEED
jgi:hypothetical protein